MLQFFRSIVTVRSWITLGRVRNGICTGKRTASFFPSPHLHHEYDEFGSFRQFSDHLDYFHRSTQQYAVISNSHTVCNIQFQYVLKRHQEVGCDVTEVFQDYQSLQIYIMSTTLLKDLIYGHSEKGYKTIQEAVEKESSALTICPYEYSGYAAVIDSVEKYYTHSMELIQPRFWQQVFLPQQPIYTKVKDEPPTKYGKHSTVKNSLVANGCVLEGEVENCILFRAVHVGKGTKLKNCIIMQKRRLERIVFLSRSFRIRMLKSARRRKL